MTVFSKINGHELWVPNGRYICKHAGQGLDTVGILCQCPPVLTVQDCANIITSLTTSKNAGKNWRELAAIFVAWSMHDPSERMLAWLLRDADMWTTVDIAGRFPLRR